MAVSVTPWLGTVPIAIKNTPYCLADLLAQSSHPPAFRAVPIAQFVALQAQPSAGGAEFYIGNSGLSSADCGVTIFASQVWPIYSMDANLIHLDQIFLMSDTDNVTMNVNFLTR